MNKIFSISILIFVGTLFFSSCKPTENRNYSGEQKIEINLHTNSAKFIGYCISNYQVEHLLSGRITIKFLDHDTLVEIYTANYGKVNRTDCQLFFELPFGLHPFSDPERHIISEVKSAQTNYDKSYSYRDDFKRAVFTSGEADGDWMVFLSNADSSTVRLRVRGVLSVDELSDLIKSLDLTGFQPFCEMTNSD